MNLYTYLIYILKNAPDWDIRNDRAALLSLLQDSAQLVQGGFYVKVRGGLTLTNYRHK